MRAALVAVLTVALSGCVVYEEPGPTEVAGRTDGYTPTPSYLKVFVKDEAGELTLVDFDRREWYVAGIAERLDERRIPYLSVHGTEREIPGEVIVDTVRDPGELADLHYEAMAVSPQQRTLLDLEYDDVLRRAGVETGRVAPEPRALDEPAVPTVLARP